MSLQSVPGGVINLLYTIVDNHSERLNDEVDSFATTIMDTIPGILELEIRIIDELKRLKGEIQTTYRNLRRILGG